jgi:mono/diheme cytochrome c family protein
MLEFGRSIDMVAIKHVILSALSAAALTALAGPTFAAGDSGSGLVLAKTWCTSCHIVAPNAAGGDTAPPFATIANRPNRSPGATRAWLTETHPPMPNLNLSNQQMDDIAAYLESLRKR